MTTLVSKKHSQNDCLGVAETAKIRRYGVYANSPTHITAISLPNLSLIAFAVPLILPMAIEWSPPNVNTRRPLLAWSYTCLLSVFVTADTVRDFFMLR